MAKSLRDVIDEFEKQRAEITAKLERVDSVLASLRQAEAVVASEELVNEQLPDPDRVGPASQINQAPKQGRLVLTPVEVIEQARAVLLEGGKPLKRGAIVRAIEARGLIVPGTEKAKNLGTILWRAGGAFVSIPGFGYWPADISYGHLYEPDR